MDQRIELFRAAFEELRNAAGEIDLRTLAEAAQGPDGRHGVTTEDVEGWLADGAVPEQRFTQNFRNLVPFLEDSAQGTGYKRKSARFWVEALSRAQGAAAEGEEPQSPTAPESQERRPLLRAVPFGEVLPHESAVVCSAWGAIDGTAMLATGTREGVVRLWDLAGERSTAHKLTADKLLPAPVVQLAWHIDGELSLVSARDAHGAVYVWDATSPDSQTMVVRTVCRWMAWGSDAGGPVLALGQADGFVRLWDPASHAFAADPVNVGLDRQDWGEWATSAGHPVIAVGSSLAGVVALYEPRTKAVQRIRCDPPPCTVERMGPGGRTRGARHGRSQRQSAGMGCRDR